MSPEIRLAPIEARNAAHRGGGGHTPHAGARSRLVSVRVILSHFPPDHRERLRLPSGPDSQPLSLSLSFSRAIKATRDLGYEVLFSGHLTTVRAVPLPSRVVVEAVPTVASRGAASAVSVAAVSPV